jgi:excisionase family DNA binding protein
VAVGAALLRVHERIYDLVSRRAIPHRKDGSRVLFKLRHLDAWIESGVAVSATAQPRSSAQPRVSD